MAIGHLYILPVMHNILSLYICFIDLPSKRYIIFLCKPGLIEDKFDALEVTSFLVWRILAMFEYGSKVVSLRF
jgi:hypothetical protein